MVIPDAVIARYFTKVLFQPGNCWLWLGALDRDGYGRFGLTHQKCVGAHRFAWFVEHGEFPPPGMELDHLCRTRECVNPLHLEVVTPKENAQRGLTGRNNQFARVAYCIRGHEFTSLNTYHYTTPKGGSGRSCRECKRTRKAE